MKGLFDYSYNLGSRFSEISRQFSLKIALQLSKEEQVTYAELDKVSGKIASWLDKRGVVAGDVIAIFHNKTCLPYAIMLACLKIGVIYTNLDTTSPVQRVKKIVKSSNPKIIFHSNNHSNCIDELMKLMPDKWVGYNYSEQEFCKEFEEMEITDINHRVTGNMPAYIMFTSGSTGHPKGVVIPHSNILNFIDWGLQEVGCTENDVFSNINPMHFDNSVFDFYLSLFTGATLVPINEELGKNPRQMVKYIEQNQCSIWFSVPSMLVYVLKLRALSAADLPKMRKIIFGGEGFPKNHLRKLYQILGKRVELINVYGPTECTCICSLYRLQEADLIKDELLPLGPMGPNFSGFAIDDNLKKIENGEVGELLICGPNVGLGYYRETKKTDGAFIQNPIHKNFRDIVYRSGDLVKWDKNRGSFLFVGRKDNQIKRMGYRIELEEIETALNGIEDVDEAACVCVGQQDNVRIFACVVSHLNELSLSSRLGEIIPIFMMPNEFRFYGNLPKNQNGKIDRVVLKQEFSG